MTPEMKGAPRQGAPECTRAGGNSGINDNPTDRILQRLDGVRQTGADQWIARCPAHEDKSPSLSIKQAGDRVLVHCFAGCHTGDVLAAVGLDLKDLFDRPLEHQGKPLTRYQKRRYGQAAEALKALLHEVRIVYVLAEQMAAGFNLDPAELERLKLAMTRIANAQAVAG